MNSLVSKRHAVSVAISLAFSSAAFAQSTPVAAVAPAAAASAPATLDKVVITGNPLGRSDIAAPVSVLTGDELTLRRGSSIGETLNGTPGVSSTYFGPNANRPVIRGLDGDRVRMLSNAGGSLDASSLSFDHAVPIDPLIVDRIEVLRGPGALLYGGSAVGGVVNALDNRIPSTRLDGLSGSAELRLGGADAERGGAALLETGNGQFGLHVDAFGRKTSDLHVPSFTPRSGGEDQPETKRVRASASDTHGGAVGGSVFFDHGYLGLSVDTYRSTYGAVAEPDVDIDMKRDHVGVAGEVKQLDGPFTGLRASFNHTRYQHQEVDTGTGAVGTTFKTAGNELRVEATHTAIGPVQGVVGLQVEDFDFSALGDEAFVPSTRTKRQALFALEDLAWSGGTLTAGLRVEHARITSDGDAADAAEPKFGAADARSFPVRSASLANVYKLTPTWSLSGSLSYTERAPTSFELYANGVHAATGAFERGDVNLGVERGNNIDVALAWKDDGNELRLGAFSTRFSRFISLEATGQQIEAAGDDGPESFPEYAFRAVRARLNGIEINGKQRLLRRDGWTLGLDGKLDYTRATNLDTGEALPRVAPLRALVGLDVDSGPWSGRVEVDGAAKQNRVPATDVATNGYAIVNASLARRFSIGNSDALWFLKLGNLGDKLAYSASTVQTVRDLSPLPGRSVKTGVRVNF
jgi:iron complex outermembrane receptor protein